MLSMSYTKKIATAAWLAVMFPNISHATLVPCGNTGQPMCKLCDLIVGINTIVKYGFGIAVIVALTFIVVGAVMYIISAGNTGMIEMAKGAMKNAAIGIIIVFVAWVFINYVTIAVGATPDLAAGWWKFKCN